MTLWSYLLTACLILATASVISRAAGEPSPTTPPTPATALRALAWMSGSWESVPTKAGVLTEEHWTSADGTIMMGMARTNRLDTTVFYEHMMIESRPDGLYYVVVPKGQERAEFKLVRSAPNEAIFENPKHDFPTRIIYRRTSDTDLFARIEGERAGKPDSVDFRFKRVALPQP